MTRPVPERRSVIIPSRGYPLSNKPTHHLYLETRECIIPGPHPESWEFIFRCQETAEERRFGVIDRELRRK